MKHLDITFDLETCSLDVNAAVMQVAAVAWNRSAQMTDDLFIPQVVDFVANVDLQSCFFDGFDFDRKTQKFWCDQPQDVKNILMNADKYPLREVIENFFSWITDTKSMVGAETVCLWSQGADFDIAILRHICRKYDLQMPLPYHNFRDARTFIIESGAHFACKDWQTALANHNEVYSAFPNMPEDKHLVHDACYDARRTTWTLWQVFSLLPEPQ